MAIINTLMNLLLEFIIASWNDLKFFTAHPNPFLILLYLIFGKSFYGIHGI